MKYLQDYMNEKQTQALRKAGAFFAFSNSQFDEQKKDGVQYVSGVAGLICPKDTIKNLMTELDNIYTEAIKQDIAENGLENIIKRELNNHEASYTGSTEDTERALADYPVTADDINKIFHNKNYKLALTA
jgi:hypothetical protein